MIFSVGDAVLLGVFPGVDDGLLNNVHPHHAVTLVGQAEADGPGSAADVKQKRFPDFQSTMFRTARYDNYSKVILSLEGGWLVKKDPKRGP